MDTRNRTECELIVSAALIGSIAECADWYTAQLAARIEQTGKAVGEMTVNELLAVLRQQRSEVSS